MILQVLTARRTQGEIARNKLNRYWGNTDAYRFRPMTSDWLGDPYRGSDSFRLTDPGDPKAFESARHALEDFGVLGPNDWRGSEDFRHLPRDEREDLELWLMEQAYRYGLALGGTPGLAARLGASTGPGRTHHPKRIQRQSLPRWPPG